jgi:hypothetical protein
MDYDELLSSRAVEDCTGLTVDKELAEILVSFGILALHDLSFLDNPYSLQV